ncbi:MAG: GFA family protein [Cellvibrionaceae bacterium]
MKTLTGSCLCGAVEFEAKDNFIYAGYCHCTRCRKASGAAGTAVGALPKSDFRLTKGEDSLTKHNRSETTTGCFCKDCGSRLYGEKPGADFIHIRYGSLDNSPSLYPQAHIFVASKADWYEINDDLPQFSGPPPLT